MTSGRDPLPAEPSANLDVEMAPAPEPTLPSDSNRPPDATRGTTDQQAPVDEDAPASPMSADMEPLTSNTRIPLTDMTNNSRPGPEIPEGLAASMWATDEEPLPTDDRPNSVTARHTVTLHPGKRGNILEYLLETGALAGLGWDADLASDSDASLTSSDVRAQAWPESPGLGFEARA